jgi:hypothetical protein
VHAGSPTRDTWQPTIHHEGIVMSKAICALKAALGIRGNACHLGTWRWYLYHNI